MQLKSIVDVPLYNTNLRIMKFWSFLLQHNWRRYSCLIPYIMINTTQFLDVYFSSEPIDAIVRNAYIAVLFFNTILRAVILCIYRFEYENFMDFIRILYIDLMVSLNATFKQMSYRELELLCWHEEHKWAREESLRV